MRRVTYLPDGQRRRAQPYEVVESWMRHTSLIPARFALATAQHESDLTLNERDEEESGYTTDGIYQLNWRDEVESLNLPTADLFTLEDSTKVFAAVCEKRARQIAEAAGVDVNNPPPDLWAYLHIAHNQGIGACLKTIASYGMDWSAYKARNLSQSAGTDKQQFFQKVASYGDDCITGGRYWSVDFDYLQPTAPVSSSDDNTTALLAVALVLFAGLVSS